MKAIGYVRASTEDQQTTLKDQAERVANFVAGHGGELIDVVTESGSGGGTLDRRPGVQEVMSRAIAGEADSICFYSLDRFSRDIISGLTEIRRLERKGVRLMSVSQSIGDSRTDAGFLSITMHLLMAEMEIRQIQSRTSRALRHMMANGKKVSHRLPYGQSPHPEDPASTVANPEELAVIELMRALRSEGLSLQQIANELRRREIKTKLGKATWNPGTISRILRS